MGSTSTSRSSRPPVPTLLRRVLPAVALGGVAGALVMALDHPAGTGASSATAPDPMVDGVITTDAIVEGDSANGESSTEVRSTVPSPPSQGASRSAAQVPASTTATTPATRAVTSPSGARPSSNCKSYTGPEQYNRFGTVQVQASVSSSGKICSVKVVQTPQDRRSVRINNYAVPILNQQAMDAQSANIQGVSGATLTTWAYVDSLQAILDAATR